MIDIRPAVHPSEIATMRGLLRDYAASLDVDLAFQDFASELDGLPGRYAAPRGRLLLAWQDDEAVGCVALRPLDAGDCEMKRLYVKPQARGLQLGRLLTERLCVEARAAGYARICLDTLPTMVAAQALYRALGFQTIKPYVFSPIPGTRYLALRL